MTSKRIGSYSEEYLIDHKGVTRQKIHYWRKIELLPPFSKGTYFRGYSFSDLKSICLILQLREAGVSIDLIRKSVNAIRNREKIDYPLLSKRLWVWGEKIYYIFDSKFIEAISGQFYLLNSVDIKQERIIQMEIPVLFDEIEIKPGVVGEEISINQHLI